MEANDYKSALIHGPRCHPGGICGYGNPNDGVMLLGISPGRDELKTGVPMTGPSGRLIDKLLEAYGWHRSKCYATNILCKSGEKASFEEIMQCRPRLMKEVETTKPKLVVLLGNPVTELFFPTRKPGSVRGMIDWYEPWGCHVLPTYHPAAILHGAAEFITRDICRDFPKIAEFFDSPPKPTVAFEIVHTAAAAQFIMDHLPTDVFIALDIETKMDKEDDANVPVEQSVVCFSISDGMHTWWFPGEYAKSLTWRKDVRWTFHNGIFDTLGLEEATGVLLPIREDTLYMSYALDERGGVHKLKTLSREYEGAGFYEEHPILKKWDDKLADKAWVQEYNSRDSAYTARIANRFWPKVVEDNMGWVYENILIPAANVYRHMQKAGIFLNKERYAYLANEWIPLLHEKEAALKAEVAALGGDPHINLGSYKQLGNFLYGTLRLPGGPSTAAPIIEALADEHPFINDLLDLRHLEKAVNTYVVGAWDDIRGDGRLHPSSLLHGTVGGRVANSPYAINTLPRATSENPYLSRIRWLFTAQDEDSILVELDYEQAEIWTAYAYSQDANMGADLRSGDFHRRNAAFIYDVLPELVTPEQRSDAKRTTFGMFYGIGVFKLAKQIDKDLIEAERLHSGWKERYKGYLAWGDDIVENVLKNRVVVTKTGRQRRFPIPMDTSFVNAAVNFPIQSTAHDALMLSIIAAHPIVNAMGARILLDVHDAMLLEAPKRIARDVACRVRDIMEEVRIPDMIRIPAEAKMGYSWAEMEKVKL